MTEQWLVSFLGWCTLINLSLLAISAVFVIVFRGPVTRLHGAMFGLKAEQLAPLYFRYLGYYKLLIFIFNLVPYGVLRWLI